MGIFEDMQSVHMKVKNAAATATGDGEAKQLASIGGQIRLAIEEFKKTEAYQAEVEPKFKLKEFTVPDRGWWNNPNMSWLGGGHTLETDPTKRGWQAHRAAPSSDLVIIGRRGVPGCISARTLTSLVDVAIYDDMTPEECAKDKNRRADEFRTTDMVPGWALEFIAELEKRSPPKTLPKVCPECASPVPPSRTNEFCSEECELQHDRESYEES